MILVSVCHWKCLGYLFNREMLFNPATSVVMQDGEREGLIRPEAITYETWSSDLSRKKVSSRSYSDLPRSRQTWCQFLLGVSPLVSTGCWLIPPQSSMFVNCEYPMDVGTAPDLISLRMAIPTDLVLRTHIGASSITRPT